MKTRICTPEYGCHANLGKAFLTEVLSQGSIRSSMDSMKIFLGRSPNLDAFIDSIV